jgi:hypothetical protein
MMIKQVHKQALLPALLLAGCLAAAPAHADLVEYSYQGTVTTVFDASTAGGIVVGDVASFHVTFDPAWLVDITAPVNTAMGTFYTNLQGASLDSPMAALNISLGAYGWAKTDYIDFFGDAGSGLPQPMVLFNNGSFFGVQFFGVNSHAITTAGVSPQPFDFVGGGGFPTYPPSYGGYFDYAGVTVAAVPEPASWGLMGLGIAGMAAWRRRAERAARITP